jgi:hypothetical protein
VRIWDVESPYPERDLSSFRTSEDGSKQVPVLGSRG